MEKNEIAKTSFFKLGEENEDFAKYFVGKSYLGLLNDEEVSIFNVTFEPGCRNNWHIHRGAGQILICVGGHGWYQEKNKAPRYLSPGDVIYIAQEIKHWHGAVKNEAFAHLALSVVGNEHTTDWFEAVTDEVYDTLEK